MTNDKYKLTIGPMRKHGSHVAKRSSIVFLQAVVVLIGAVALSLLLIEPRLEGVNAQASFFQTYFDDPFLAYVYIGSIPFFVALFQSFKMLGFIGRNQVFSQSAVNTLKIIKYCAFITAGAIIAAIIYLRVAAFSNGEDSAGAVMLGVVVAFVSVVVGIAAAVFQKTLQSAVDIKSENDLTV